MEWYEKVKELKNKTQMTNEQLAQAAGMPLGTLNKLLAGQTSSPKLSSLQAFAAAFSTSVSELIGESSANSLATFPEDYDKLDDVGKRAVNDEIARQLRRIEDESKRTRIELDTESVREIALYDVPVSAGCGSFLDTPSSSVIKLDVGELADRADYAVKVSGDSMEPKYHDGDIVIVESCGQVPVGAIGIFLVGGESYIKKYAGDRLHSVNPAYKDIQLTGDSICLGRVLARLKRSAV